MASDRDFRQLMRVRYDRAGDILTFSFTAHPQPAVAEEAADDMWVRYDPDHASRGHSRHSEFFRPGADDVWVAVDVL